MRITSYDNTMADAVDQLIRRAFEESEYGYSGEAELVQALRDDGAVVGEIVAFNRNQLVGHALLSRAHVGPVEGVVLAPLSVLPEYQLQGIGSALMAKVEALARDEDMAFISLLGDPDYYQRFGYLPASRWGVTAPMPVPDEAFLLKILKLRFAPSGTLKYADAFGL